MSLQRLGPSAPHTYFREQDEKMTHKPFTSEKYKEVEIVASFKISIPDPFPEQQMSSSPKPLMPFILLERLKQVEFDLFKVVTVRDVGGMMDGAYAEWGSILVHVSRFLDKGYKVLSDSYDPKDPVVKALDKMGLLEWHPMA